jgi:hypothetical protein
MISLNLYYLGMKTFFLFSIVRSLVVFDPLKRHWLFLACLYTAGVAFMSAIFYFWPNRIQPFSTREQQVWIGLTLVLTAIYFKLLIRFDEGIMFWVILLLGLGLVWY